MDAKLRNHIKSVNLKINLNNIDTNAKLFNDNVVSNASFKNPIIEKMADCADVYVETAKVNYTNYNCNLGLFTMPEKENFKSPALYYNQVLKGIASGINNSNTDFIGAKYLYEEKYGKELNSSEIDKLYSKALSAEDFKKLDVVEKKALVYGLKEDLKENLIAIALTEKCGYTLSDENKKAVTAVVYKAANISSYVGRNFVKELSENTVLKHETEILFNSVESVQKEAEFIKQYTSKEYVQFSKAIEPEKGKGLEY